MEPTTAYMGAERSQGEPRRSGRPRGGTREGEKVRDYPRLTVRVTPEMKQTLRALSVVSRTPQWKVICDAISCRVNELPDSQQKTIRDMVRTTEVV